MTALCPHCRQSLPDPIYETLGVSPGTVHLTSSEIAILQLLGKRRGKLVAHSSLVQLLSGFHTAATTDAIKTHMRRLRAKVPFLRIRTVYGEGYVMDPPGQQSPRAPAHI